MIIEAACVDDPQRTHKDGGIARRVERLHGILAAVDARLMQQVEQHRFQRLVLLPVEKPVFPDDIRKYAASISSRRQ